MKKNLAATLSGALAVALLGLAAPASADFSGDYAPANWLLTKNGGDGTVDTAGAPGSIVLTGSNASALAFTSTLTTYTIVAPGAGNVSFDWSFQGEAPGVLSGPLFDPAGFFHNGSTIQLSDDNGAQSQNGINALFAVAQGDTFGFYVETIDNLGDPGIFTVRNFTGPSNGTAPTVPEPESLALLALGLLGVAVARRRRQP